MVDQVQEIQNIDRYFELCLPERRYRDAVAQIELIRPRRTASHAREDLAAVILRRGTANPCVELIPARRSPGYGVVHDDLVGRGRDEKKVIVGHTVAVRVVVETERVRPAGLTVVKNGGRAGYSLEQLDWK